MSAVDERGAVLVPTTSPLSAGEKKSKKKVCLAELGLATLTLTLTRVERCDKIVRNMSLRVL